MTAVSQEETQSSGFSLCPLLNADILEQAAPSKGEQRTGILVPVPVPVLRNCGATSSNWSQDTSLRDHRGRLGLHGKQVRMITPYTRLWSFSREPLRRNGCREKLGRLSPRGELTPGSQLPCTETSSAPSLESEHGDGTG